MVKWSNNDYYYDTQCHLYTKQRTKEVCTITCDCYTIYSIKHTNPNYGRLVGTSIAYYTSGIPIVLVLVLLDILFVSTE